MDLKEDKGVTLAAHKEVKVDMVEIKVETLTDLKEVLMVDQAVGTEIKEETLTDLKAAKEVTLVELKAEVMVELKVDLE